jgi:hypothetical protein
LLYGGAVQAAQLDGVQRVYVRAPNWVGDLVMATATFARLRAAFPRARIVCGLRPYLRALLDGENWFDQVLAAPRGGLRGSPPVSSRSWPACRYGSATGRAGAAC